MKIRFLYFEGCPHKDEALELLHQVLEERGIEGEIEMVEVRPEEAASEGFLGSPTIQINGRDIEKERRGDPPYYGCRIYPGGRGVPPKEMIMEALKRSMKR